MKTTEAYASYVSRLLRGLLGFLVALSVSGCGLSMDNSDRLMRAEQAFADGEYRAAVIDAKNVLLEEPDNVNARLLLGRASVAFGDGATAEKELGHAIRLGTSPAAVAPEMARALLIQSKFEGVLDDVPFEGLATSEAETAVRVARGDAFLGLRQPESAREMFVSALQLQSENLDARIGVVSTYIAESNFIQARGGIDELLVSYAENPQVWLYSAAFNARGRDLESAEANFRVALNLANAQADEAARLRALSGLADTLLQRNSVDQARAHVDQLAVAAPQSLQTKLLTARISYHDEDWATAQQVLQQVLKVAPDYQPAQMLLGAVHMRSGNLGQAEMHLSAAVAASPGDVRARQMLAETQLQLRKADEAQAVLAPIVAGPDVDTMSLQMAARASLSRRDIDEALKYLQRSVEKHPDNADLRFQLAATLLQSDRHAEAQAVLDRVDVSNSEDNAYRRDALNVLTALREGDAVVALMAAQRVAENYDERSGAFNLLGALQLLTTDLNGARSSFETAMTLEPQNMTARKYLAAMDESAGELDSAIGRYNAILVDRPDAAWAMFALGRIAAGQADFESAATNFRRASAAEPQNADYRLSLARAERQLGNKQQAAALLEGNANDSLAHFPSALTLGTLKAESGDIDGALEFARKLKNRYPDNPAAHAFEGEVHLLGGDPSLADVAYEQALKLGPEKGHSIRSFQIKRQLGVVGAERPLVRFLEVRPLDNDVKILLAESYMESENIGQSIATYEQVVSAEPMNAIALNNLAWSYYLVDDPRAVETAKKANDAMPENGAIADTLGWILVQDGQVEEGERLLRKAVKLENRRSEIRYHHAAALAKLGRTEEARQTLNDLLAGDDEFASRADAASLLSTL